MKILLINPNHYKHPPVIPVGLEYLKGSLSQTSHEGAILDLCFSNDPLSDITKSIKNFDPGLIGITIRQIDTVLYPNNEFFLSQIKEYVEHIHSSGIEVLLGGAGYSIMPHEILEYTDADYGIYGPGEIALKTFLDTLEQKENVKKITDGYSYFKKNKYVFPRSISDNYNEYIKNEGIVGFRTQIGCTFNCFFCTEGNKKVIFHEPESVGEEIKKLKSMGYNKFHLCDSEFNIELNHCIDVCRSIYEIAGKTDWVLYMKPEPFSEELFSWLQKSGAGSMTLSVDSKSNNSIGRLKYFFEIAKSVNIKIAIDLSVGYPNEELEKTEEFIRFLGQQPVATIGINSYYRIYPGTPLYNDIIKEEVLNQYIINRNKKHNYLFPAFFNFIPEEKLRELTGNNSKFRIEGFEKATNYQRIN